MMDRFEKIAERIVASKRPPAKVQSAIERKLKQLIRKEGTEWLTEGGENYAGFTSLFDWLFDELRGQLEDEFGEVEIDDVHDMAEYLEPRLRRKYASNVKTAAAGVQIDLSVIGRDENADEVMFLEQVQDELGPAGNGLKVVNGRIKGRIPLKALANRGFIEVLDSWDAELSVKGLVSV